MEETSTERTPDMDREDTLHVGATRPIMFLGLPMQVAVGILMVGYFIQTTITGLSGIIWAAIAVGPCWFICAVLVSQDPYGLNVALAWYQTCFLCSDKKIWGGVSRSPLPANHRKAASCSAR